jgi:hypothetical protein
MKAATFLAVCLACAANVSADPIAATLEGCVSVTDARLLDASWFASGTFQAVAFHDPEPGCEATILWAIDPTDAYRFEEDRAENTLLAQLNLARLPSCGRVQYDLHAYLDAGLLDPFGLKSLVVDTGLACAPESPLEPPRRREVSEPLGILMMAYGALWLAWRGTYAGD